MNRIDQYAQYAEWGLVALTALVALLYAWRASRPHHVRPVPELVAGIVPFVALYAVMRFGGVGLAWLPGGIALVMGVTLGVLLGIRARVGRLDGRAVVKPSRAVPWLTAIAWVLLALAILFVDVYAASAALVLVVLVSALGLTETVVHTVRGLKTVGA